MKRGTKGAVAGGAAAVAAAMLVGTKVIAIGGGPAYALAGLAGAAIGYKLTRRRKKVP